MSDKIIALNQHKRCAEIRKEHEPIRTSNRLQWMAGLVCAILNAEKHQSVVGDPEKTPNV